MCRSLMHVVGCSDPPADVAHPASARTPAASAALRDKMLQEARRLIGLSQQEVHPESWIQSSRIQLVIVHVHDDDLAAFVPALQSPFCQTPHYESDDACAQTVEIEMMRRIRKHNKGRSTQKNIGEVEHTQRIPSSAKTKESSVLP